MKNWLHAFQNQTHNRKGNKHYSDSLITEHGVFVISTQPGTVDSNGMVTLAGDSREQGYFIAPRMIWVDSIEEAKLAFTEDIKNGNWLPLDAYRKSAEAAPSSP